MPKMFCPYLHTLRNAKRVKKNVAIPNIWRLFSAFRALAQDDDLLPEERFKVNSKKGGVFLSEFFTFGRFVVKFLLIACF